MVIEALDSNVIALIRSSSAIDSVTQCVTELVLNSLDARPTSIAVRVNLTNFRIQIVDNGKGISRRNLELVGQRYMTNKCHNLSDLKKHISSYGFKGEALASIAKTSHRLSVTSREEHCEETYCKVIEGDESKIDLVKSRPSFGTTVTVEGFLSNLPVRQQCIKSNELENVKKSLESLIIIHPRVAFSLRNDSNGKIVLDSRRSVDIAGAFKNIHPEVDEDGFTLFRVSKNKTSVDGLIHKEFHENKRLQYVYVNKRPISCPKVQNLINSTFKKVTSDPKKTQPIFVLHIKCPYSDIDLNLEPAKTVVFFKKYDLVKRCIEKLINTLLGKETVRLSPKKSDNEVKSQFSLSQIGGAVKGLGMKRRSDDLEEIVPNKSPKIVDDTPVFEEPKIVTKQTKKALPIAIKRNEKKENFDCDEMHFDEIKENSLYTNFPDNERKGKDIIMDMFIKSVQVFPKESKSSSDHSSANSASVDGFKLSPVKTDHNGVEEMASVRENMVSVGVQTGPEIINPLEDFPLGNINDVTFCPRKSLKNFVSDYNFDFSKVDTCPNVNQKFTENFTFLNSFDQTKKLFDFRDNQSKQCNIFDATTSAQYFAEQFCEKKRNDNIFENNDRLRSDAKLTIERYFPKKKTVVSKTNFENIQQSPFFLKKNKERKNILSLKRPYRSQPVENQKQAECVAEDSSMETVTIAEEKPNQKLLWNTSLDNRRDQILMTCCRKNNAKKKLNESVTSSYFAPQKQDSLHDHSKDLFLSNKPASYDSGKEKEVDDGIVITISESDKQKLIDRDLAYQKPWKDDDIIPSTLTQSQNNWWKEVNMFGNTFYTNKKTGVKTLRSPKKDLSFEIVERFAFVPKGLSPILKDYGTVESMSPESKENLQNAMIEAYDDELLLVKWQNYINNKDPKKFFEEMYIEKSKLIENLVPNVSKSGPAKHEIRENVKFTMEMFKTLEIIGQVDCKFIAALDKAKNLIVLFDQHAVHERVRLEQLSGSYKNASTKVDQNVMIFLPTDDLGLIRNHRMNLYSLGLGFDIFRDGINIRQVPLCLYNKFKKGANLTTLIETLIKEIVEILKDNNGILVNTPKLIQNIINSEACRGAIKFGDSLSKTECYVHLKQLSECTLPFQCAHGRPTLTPLISLRKSCNSRKTKVHLSALRQ